MISSMTGKPIETDFVNREWIHQYCKFETENAEERYDRDTRHRNDPYANGIYAGRLHTLRDLSKLMDMLDHIAPVGAPSHRCLKGRETAPLIPYCTWPFFCNGDPVLCGVRGGDRIYPKVVSTRKNEGKP